jgi:hypothetical protein
LTLVLEEFRPTLRDELRRLKPRLRWPVTALLVLIALAAAGLIVRKAEQPGTHVVHQGSVAFNLRYTGPLKRVAPHPHELLRLEWRTGGVVQASFVVEALKLPAYKGDVSGILPIMASRDQEALRKQFPTLEPVEEGKARVNKVPAYSSTFRASRSPRLYGRVVLLPQAMPGAVDGVRIVMLQTPNGGANVAADVASHGILKTPYRTFRFGTQGP